MKISSLRESGRRGFVVIIVGMLIVLVSLTIFPTVGRAADTPTVTFSQSTGLRDGQVITVRWSGFTPGENVYVRQCAHVNATAEQPDLPNSQPESNLDCGTGLAAVASDGNGNGLAFFPVMVTIGTGNSIPGDLDLICGAGKDCFLVAMTRSQLRVPSSAHGLQRLTFSADATSCPESGQTALNGGGTGAVNIGITDWQLGICQAPTNTTLDYVATKGDAGGRQDFLCGLRDFALTETPGPANEACFLNGAKRPHIFVPLANNSLVFAYNIRDKVTKQRIEDLKLTPSMLAWVFTGRTLAWSSFEQTDLHAKQIADLNIGHVLPNNIQVIGRADQSSLNYLLTRFFIERAKEALWAGGASFQFDEPTEFYPSAQGLDLKTTPAAVANVLSQSDDRDGVMGWIGVMDAATAAYYGLPTVAIGTTSDPATASFVSSTSESVAKGIALMTDSGQGTLEANVWPSDSDAYPLPITVYAELPTDSSLTQDQVDSTKAWLKFVKEQEILAPGYVPLSAVQKLAIQNSLTKFEIQPTPKPTPSVTPTPTASPSESPAINLPDFNVDSSDPGFYDPGTVDPGTVDPGSDNASVDAAAPVSIFAQNVSYSSPLSTASLPVLLFLAGLGITGFGAWQLSWGKKK